MLPLTSLTAAKEVNFQGALINTKATPAQFKNLNVYPVSTVRAATTDIAIKEASLQGASFYGLRFISQLIFRLFCFYCSSLLLS